MNNFLTSPNKIHDKWYCFVLIEGIPFVVISTQKDFSIARIHIYNSILYSVDQAYEDFSKKNI